MSFEERVNALWDNPNAVDLSSPFLYFVTIVDPDGNEFRYIGKARNKSRLHEYRRSMLKIAAGKERGAKQGYRAVHHALFTALRQNWPITFIALENCNKERLNEIERLRTRELGCNLNNGKSWRVAELEGLLLKHLLREDRT